MLLIERHPDKPISMIFTLFILPGRPRDRGFDLSGVHLVSRLIWVAKLNSVPLPAAFPDISCIFPKSPRVLVTHSGTHSGDDRSATMSIGESPWACLDASDLIEAFVLNSLDELFVQYDRATRQLV
jgi:hypothetical protein